MRAGGGTCTCTRTTRGPTSISTATRTERRTSICTRGGTRAARSGSASCTGSRERGDPGAAHRRGAQPEGAARLFLRVRRRHDDRDARRVAVAGGNRAARLGAGSAVGDGAARGSGGDERGGGVRVGGAGCRRAVSPSVKRPTVEGQRHTHSALDETLRPLRAV